MSNLILFHKNAADGNLTKIMLQYKVQNACIFYPYFLFSLLSSSDLHFHIKNNYFQDESKMSLSLEQDNIIWPGGLRKKPTGLMIPTHLNVLTISEQPFVYNRTLAPGEICDRDGEILCPQYNTEASNPTVSCKPISR